MTAPDVNADVRARFEAWARGKGLDVTRWNERKRGVLPNEYMKLDTDMAWAGYRAAHAALAGEVRELVEAVCSYRSALAGVNSAMQDGVNVHGALSAIYGAEENLDAALAKHTHQEKP